MSARPLKRPSRKKHRPIAVFDLDGTLVREQLLVLLAKECFDLQIFRRVAEVVFKRIRLQHRDRKITFEDYDRRIIDIFVERVKGKLRSDVQMAAEAVFDKHRDWLYRFTKALTEEVAETHQRITITGAMQETVQLLAPYWGMEHWYATELEVDGSGRYTGQTVALPVRDKRTALMTHIREHGGSLKGSVAIGDTLSDVPMLGIVERPIVFNPDDKLATIAEERRWPVVVERKGSIFVIRGTACRRFSAKNEDDTRRAVRHVLALR